MSEITPLLGRHLPALVTQVQDHPIFLRVAHSPWSLINQSTLVWLRGLILAYLTAFVGMLLDYKINKKDDQHTAWNLLFTFSTLAFSLQWIYNAVAFSWTFTHLYYPDVDATDNRWESKVLNFLSPPIQTAESRNRFYFSLFYTVTHVFTFMNVISYWAVSVPNGHGQMPLPDTPSGWPLDDMFAKGWFIPFCILNLYGVTALIAMNEIFVLNSVKRQVPVLSHVFALIFLTGAWLGWASFGQVLTGHYAYFWMDRSQVGHTEIVAAACSAFVGSCAPMFAFMYGLIGMRENLTGKEGDQQSGSYGHGEHTAPTVPTQSAVTGQTGGQEGTAGGQALRDAMHNV